MADDDRIYDALALPAEALENGGLEILRAGLIKDELFVTARRVFKDPAPWGEVLADIARRIAVVYSAEDTDLTAQEILTEIEQAFAADLGAPVIKDARPAGAKTGKNKPAKKSRARKAPAKRKAAKKTARKSAKRKKS
jgi:hypothetical protein